MYEYSILECISIQVTWAFYKYNTVLKLRVILNEAGGQMIRVLLYSSAELGTRNTKTLVFRVYRYKHENPRRNMKQTRKIGKLAILPNSFKSYLSPLRSIAHWSWDLYYKRQFFTWLFKVLQQHEKTRIFWNMIQTRNHVKHAYTYTYTKFDKIPNSALKPQ